MPKLDPETAKVVSETEKIAAFVQGEDWKLVRARLIKKIAALDSITDIPQQMNMADRMVEYAARQLAIQSLLDVIYSFEGDAMMCS